MENNVELRTMKCPTCGAPLKTDNPEAAIECLYCGNTVVPVSDNSPTAEGNASAASFAQNALTGTVKIEGIKTPSSALAYAEQFFEDYDWELFAYAQTMTISHLEDLAKSHMTISADDKNTWIACFKIRAVPFIKKAENCSKILEKVIVDYKKDNLDAYSKFDAYKRVSSMILNSKEDTVIKLEKYVEKAKKYGASAEEVNELNSTIEEIENIIIPTQYQNVEDIPEIKKYIDETNEKIIMRMAERGINAEQVYAEAKMHISQQNYVEALNTLLTIKGYSDTNKLIREIDRYYLISDILEIENKLYFFQRETEESETLSLYPTQFGKVSGSPIIKDIGKIITNYADILYYLDGHNKIKSYDLKANVSNKVDKRAFDRESMVLNSKNRKVYLLSVSDFSTSGGELVELDLASGMVRQIAENVAEISSLVGSKLAYKADNVIKIYNIETMSETFIPNSIGCMLRGYTDNYVVYTVEAPNEFNLNLYVKKLDDSSPEVLVEKNIYKFFDIIDGKLFYLVGNYKYKTLINIDPDGSNRKRWKLSISEFLFEQGGWIYFIRRSGYNSVLCKAHMDGSNYCVIASYIKKFIELKNGFLYYIDDESSLIKIRMDGSNYQPLCKNVDNVLSLKEDCIVFVTSDGSVSEGYNALGGETYREIKSIYSIDFDGALTKLVYDIKDAKEYDDNTVYYVENRDNPESTSEAAAQTSIDSLYSLTVDTSKQELLLITEKLEEPKSNGFGLAMFIMLICLVLGIVGLATEAGGLAAIGLIGALISLFVGLKIKGMFKS